MSAARNRSHQAGSWFSGPERSAQYCSRTVTHFRNWTMAEARRDRRSPGDLYLDSDRRYSDRDLLREKIHYLRFRLPLLRPQIKIWRQMLAIGVPAGAEFVLLFVYILLVYAIIRGFGPAAQAGFGVGVRVMQALFLPVVALSFAVAPVVGQNFGGRRSDRVRRSVMPRWGLRPP
jgi:hypothetical protein